MVDEQVEDKVTHDAHPRRSPHARLPSGQCCHLLDVDSGVRMELSRGGQHCFGSLLLRCGLQAALGAGLEHNSREIEAQVAESGAHKRSGLN